MNSWLADSSLLLSLLLLLSLRTSIGRGKKKKFIWHPEAKKNTRFLYKCPRSSYATRIVAAYTQHVGEINSLQISHSAFPVDATRSHVATCKQQSGLFLLLAGRLTCNTTIALRCVMLSYVTLRYVTLGAATRNKLAQMVGHRCSLDTARERTASGTSSAGQTWELGCSLLTHERPLSCLPPNTEAAKVSRSSTS